MAEVLVTTQAEFHSVATRFVGCPVRVADIVVHPNPKYPQKIKSPGCCGPVFEVDRYGKRLAVIPAVVAKEPSHA